MILAAVSIRAAYNSGIINFSIEGTQKYQKEANKEESVISETEEWMKSIINKIGNQDDDDDDDDEKPPIDWEKAKEEAEKHPDQEESEDIGIGTDGKSVNLDLWDYIIDPDNENGILLKADYSSGGSPGYRGDFVNGEIIGLVPQYIKMEGYDDFLPVTNMWMTFAECQDLLYAPELPTTVVNMGWTFYECYYLISAPTIPESANYFEATFSSCYNLTGSLVINVANDPYLAGTLRNVATEDGCDLILSGSSPYLVDFLRTKSDNSNIHISNENITLVEEIVLGQTSLSISDGEEFALTATVYPNDATIKNIVWTSSDNSIATVDEGEILGKKPGTVTITAESYDESGTTATCTVTVTPCVAFSQNNIDYTWADVHEMAKIISGTSSINKLSSSANIVYNSNNVTLTVGQTLKITDDDGRNYSARIIGFNTDLLSSDSNQNGTYSYTGTYAGITLEFINYLRCGYEYASDSWTPFFCYYGENTGGWSGSRIRSVINSGNYYSFTDFNYIKKVVKTYNTGGGGNQNSTCEDKYWLLACSEMFELSNDLYGGVCNTNESTMTPGISETRYTFYNGNYNTARETEWWLRSPSYSNPSNYGIITTNNTCSTKKGWGSSPTIRSKNISLFLHLIKNKISKPNL